MENKFCTSCNNSMYIYLDDDERRFFAQHKLQYLIEQIQVNPIPINNSNHGIIRAIKFSNPMGIK